MSSYHTRPLAQADIFTLMGSMYAEVARYDTAISQGLNEQAHQAVYRAKELIDFSQSLTQLNSAQKQEIQKFKTVFLGKVRKTQQSGLDSYLMPFAVAARKRQLK